MSDVDLPSLPNGLSGERLREEREEGEGQKEGERGEGGIEGETGRVGEAREWDRGAGERGRQETDFDRARERERESDNEEQTWLMRVTGHHAAPPTQREPETEMSSSDTEQIEPDLIFMRH